MNRLNNINKKLFHRLFILTMLFCGMMGLVVLMPQVTAEESGTAVPLINVPHFDGTITTGERAVFWFGEVNETSNYADVRVGYNDDEIIVQVAAFDRLLWFDNTPTVAEIPNWDGATLYLNLNGNNGNVPSSQSYKFLGMYTPNAANTFGAFQGNGASWVNAPAVDFSVNAGTQASGFNNTKEDDGWWIAFVVPFTELGLSGAPTDGSEWGVGIALHDRDDNAGTPIADQIWPDGMDGERPSTYGRFSFGTPTYQAPAATAGGTTVIRDGENGMSVVDAHAGGHSLCGGDLWPDRFFSDWGYRNYDGYPQINIQNQFNLGDWPCFSKYFVTFPLDTIPADKVILSAELSMYQFGNAGQGGSPTPQPTLINVMSVDSAWDEGTLNWNNAPQVQENYATSWAGTIPPQGDGFFVTWDMSRAVAETVAAGSPLRLALYTADSNHNSGKYFVSSEGAVSKPERRPTLTVVWGNPPLQVTPSLWSIEAGGVATYTISADALTGPVTISAQNPSADLHFDLSPTVITPPQTATLVVTDLHGVLPAGILYSIPIEATNGSQTLETAVTLLVGGDQVYLPTVQR
ncbi:MAG: DNRLRE domain-containing protein [Chloroflexi bacterium]|nr:DNRLRE domain-containing protein [Chloroflexota bacterium]